MPQTFESAEALKAAIGKPLGPSDWLVIEQERINLFADATDDHQWIHVDVERAKQGPFGAPIAHGYLALSLVSHFLPQLLVVPNAKMGVNYGCNKVRFPSGFHDEARRLRRFFAARAVVHDDVKPVGSEADCQVPAKAASGSSHQRPSSHSILPINRATSATASVS